MNGTQTARISPGEAAAVGMTSFCEEVAVLGDDSGCEEMAVDADWEAAEEVSD